MHEQVIPPFALYRYVSSASTLRQEYSVRVSEGRELWEIFGIKRIDVYGDGRNADVAILQFLLFTYRYASLNDGDTF